MLVFTSIKWKNFLSTGNDWTEISLSNHGTTCIVGANGSGKSSFSDAITFALYNKPFRKINKPGLVNSINGKNCLVEVEFKNGKDSFLIRRGIRPNIFEIVKNGELVNQEASNRDYQEILENHILKMSFRSFCQVVILGSASFVPFMQLPTGQRREIIEDLLDIQIFTTMNSLLKDKMNTNARDLLDVDYRYDLVTEKLKMQEDHVRSMLTSSEEVKASLNEKIEKYRREIETEQAIIDEKRREQSVLIERTSNHDALTKKVGELSTIRGKLVDKSERIRSEIAFFHDSETCPTCRQAIDESFRKETVSSREGELAQVEDGLERITETRSELETRLEGLRKTLDRVSSINVELNIKASKVRSLESSIKDLEDEVSKVERKSVSYVEDDGTTRELEDERDSVADDRRRLLEVRDVQRVAARILKDDGIKSRIIKQYIPIINKLINKYLASMDFFVQFELDENFNETIRSRFRDAFSYSSFSEGEKARIDLALLFAWRTVAKLRNSASTNLLILDEIFDGSMDAVGSDDFLNILYSVAGETNVFVISHKTDQMKDKFDRIIEFEKRNNFSRIANIEENVAA